MNKKIKYSALFCATLITVGTALAIKVGREVVNAAPGDFINATKVTNLEGSKKDNGKYIITATTGGKTYYVPTATTERIAGKVSAKINDDLTGDTISVDKIPADSYWDVAYDASSSSYSIYYTVDSTTYVLSLTNANNGVRATTDTGGSNWNIKSTSEGVYSLSVTIGSSKRNLSLYIGTPNWRCYTSTNGVQTINLYKVNVEESGTSEPEPTGYTATFKTNGGSKVSSQEGVQAGAKLSPVSVTKSGFDLLGWFVDTNNDGIKDEDETYWDFDNNTVSGDVVLTAEWTMCAETSIDAEFKDGQYYRIRAEFIAQTGSSNYYVQNGNKAFTIYDKSGMFTGVKPGNTISLYGSYTTFNKMEEFTNIKDVTIISDDQTINTVPLTDTSAISSDNYCRYAEFTKLKLESRTESSSRIARFDGIDCDFTVGKDYMKGYEWTVNKVTQYIEVGKYYDVKCIISSKNVNGDMVVLPLRFTESKMDVTFAGAEEVAQQVDQGSKAAKPETDPAKTGYRFDGWYLDANKNGTIDTGETAYDFETEVKDDIQLVAKWVKQVNVVFTGVSETENPATQTFDEGKTATKPTDPTKTGNRFDGWYAASATTAYDFTTAVTEDTTLTAKWTELVDVTFVGTETTTSTVGKGEKVTKPTDPTKDNYRFDGWFVDANKNGKADSTETEFDFDTAVNASMQLVAKWTTCRVTIVGSTISNYEVAPGAKVSKPATDPEKKGNNFDGWYLDANKNGTIDSTETAYDFDSAVTSDIQIIAKWTPSNPIAITVATYKSVMNVAYTYKASVVSSTEVTYSKVDFRLMVGVESAFLYNTGAKAADDYGIVVTDSKGKVMKFSAKEGSTSYTDFSLTRDRSYSYVVIDLGDVLNNTDRATNAFTVQCYVTLDGDDYTNSGKTYSVAQMIEAYYGMDDYKDSVEDTYNLFKALGLIK